MEIQTRSSFKEKFLNTLKKLLPTSSPVETPNIQGKAYINELTQQSFPLGVASPGYTAQGIPIKSKPISQPIENIPSSSTPFEKQVKKVGDKLTTFASTPIGSTILQIINPLAASIKSSLDTELQKTKILQQQAEELYQKAQLTPDKITKSQLFTEAIKLNTQARKVSELIPKHTVNTIAGFNTALTLAGLITGSKLSPVEGAGLVRYIKNLPYTPLQAIPAPIPTVISKTLFPEQYQALEDARKKIMVDYYRQKYPQVVVPQNLPYNEQEKIYKDYLKQKIQQETGFEIKDISPPQNLRDVAKRAWEIGWKEGVLQSIYSTAQQTFREIGFPSIAHYFERKKNVIESEVKSKGLDQIPNYIEETIKNPKENIAKAIVYYPVYALPYTLFSVLGATFGGVSGGNLAIYSVEKGRFQEELENKGIPHDTAESAATLYGALSAAIENMSGYTPAGLSKWLTQDTTNVLKTGLKSFITKTPKSLIKTLVMANEEGLEEVWQYASEVFVKQFLNSEEVKQYILPQITKEAVQNYVGGFISSLPLGITTITQKPQVKGLTIKEELGLNEKNLLPNATPSSEQLANKVDIGGNRFIGITQEKNQFIVNYLIARTNKLLRIPFKTEQEALNYAINLFIIPAPTGEEITTITTPTQTTTSLSTRRQQIINKIRKLNIQLDNTTDNVEASTLQSQINNLIKQLNQLETIETKPEIQPETQPETKPETKPEIQLEIQPEIQPKTQPKAQPEVQPETKTEVKPESQPEVKPEIKFIPISGKQQIEEVPIRVIENFQRKIDETEQQIQQTPLTENAVEKEENIKEVYHKPSKIGLKIKTIGEQRQVNVPEVATYQPVSVKEEIDKARQFIKNNPTEAIDIISGKKSLPEGFKIGSFINAAEELLNEKPELIPVLANSPIVSETSRIAQELRLMAPADPDSFLAKVEEIKAARLERANKTSKGFTQEVIDLHKTIHDAVIQSLLKKSPNNTPLVEAFKKGEITIGQLLTLPSDERIKLLTQYLGANAYQANLEFENKLILKYIDRGIQNWLQKYGLFGKYHPEKLKEIQKSIQEWKEKQFERMFKPKEYETFLQSLVAKKLGIEITQEEAEQLFTLTQKVQELKQKWNPDTQQWESEKSAKEYGAAKVLLEKYVVQLKQPISPKEIWKEEIAKIQAIAQDNKPRAVLTAINDFIKFISDFSISIVASVDNSFLGRQGIKTLYTHPNIWLKAAYRSVVNFVQTIKHGEAVWDAILADYYSRPNYMNGSYEIAKIVPSITERYPTTTPSHIPLLGRIFTASEIAFKGSDLIIRENVYDLVSYLIAKNGVDMTDPYQIKSLGIVVNSLASKGSWGEGLTGNKLASGMSLVLWAPRLLKSNIDILTAHIGQDISPAARKYAAANLVKILANIAFILLLFKLLDKDSIDFDPRSSKFGKIMIGPNRDISIDITGGMGSIITLASRIALQSTKSATTGKITPLFQEGHRWSNVTHLIANFIEGKTTPIIHAVISILNSEMYGGKKPTIGRLIMSTFAPISIQNIAELSQVEVYRRPAALWAVIADIFGFNANTPLRAIKYEQPIIQEIIRLQNAGYDRVQTNFISGYIQDNPNISIKENQWIKDNITLISNKLLLTLISHPLYKEANDDTKARYIAGFMDNIRDLVYSKYILDKIQNKTGKELIQSLKHLYRSGILTKTRFENIIKSGVLSVSKLQEVLQE